MVYARWLEIRALREASDMTDFELFSAIRQILVDNLPLNGMAGATVVQNFQPTTQGRPAGPAIYITKLFDTRYGHTKRTELYDPSTPLPEGPDFLHTETQFMESTFQINATYPQNPNVITPTASDLANTGCMILASDRAMDFLRPLGAKPLRVGQVRNPQFVNDADQFEAVPSFDFILTHQRAITTRTPAAQSIEDVFGRVTREG